MLLFAFLVKNNIHYTRRANEDPTINVLHISPNLLVRLFQFQEPLEIINPAPQLACSTADSACASAHRASALKLPVFTCVNFECSINSSAKGLMNMYSAGFYEGMVIKVWSACGSSIAAAALSPRQLSIAASHLVERQIHTKGREIKISSQSDWLEVLSKPTFNQAQRQIDPNIFYQFNLFWP